jgi:hypothetical protein
LNLFHLFCLILATVLLLGACVPTPTGNAIDPPETELIATLEIPSFTPRGARGPADPETELTATLEMPSRLPNGETVKLKFTLTNNSEVDLYVLEWYTPLEGIAGEIFRIERDGQLMPYDGTAKQQIVRRKQNEELQNRPFWALNRYMSCCSFSLLEPGH